MNGLRDQHADTSASAAVPLVNGHRGNGGRDGPQGGETTQGRKTPQRRAPVACTAYCSRRADHMRTPFGWIWIARVSSRVQQPSSTSASGAHPAGTWKQPCVGGRAEGVVSGVPLLQQPAPPALPTGSMSHLSDGKVLQSRAEGRGEGERGRHRWRAVQLHGEAQHVRAGGRQLKPCQRAVQHDVDAPQCDIRGRGGRSLQYGDPKRPRGRARGWQAEGRGTQGQMQQCNTGPGLDRWSRPSG